MTLKLILVFICFNSIFSNNFVRSEGNLVKTTSGTVKGSTLNVLNKTIEQYLGIPFAEPPIGSLRFAKPKPISIPIEGIIDATKSKYSCVQPVMDQFKDFMGNLTYSEDCLTLNIWAPKIDNQTKLKPVMFWIYGGGLEIGSIYQLSYNGMVLATNDVVFVSTNYRLGMFGFLYGGEESAPGNVGFYDQNLALKWVRENIHLFGGDKNEITIFGESAGSWSVSAQLLSPESKGLFKRAIMESGAHLYNKDKPIDSKEVALKKAKDFAKSLNCSDNKQWLECLRKLEAKQLLPSDNSLPEFVYPVLGTEFLPISAQKAFEEKRFNKDLELMAGVTKDEGSALAVTQMPELLTKNLTKHDFESFINKVNPIFNNLNTKKIIEFYLNNTKANDSKAIKWGIFNFFGELLIKCPTYLFAKSYAQNSYSNTSVYFYEITYTDPNGLLGNQNDLGVQHGTDVLFVFGLNLLNPKASEEVIAFSKEIMKYWTDFAKYGKPDDNWPLLIDSERHSSVTQIKDLTPKNKHKYLNDLFDDTCDGFWRNYF